MIEDDELRELFQVESDEHLQIIESGLLELEKNPNDYDTLHLIFREAHSMKGASRMLGLSDIESISHIFEESLGKAGRGEFTLTSNQIDIFYEGLDAIHKLVKEAVTGEKNDLDIVSLLERLLHPEETIVSSTPKKPRQSNLELSEVEKLKTVPETMNTIITKEIESTKLNTYETEKEEIQEDLNPNEPQTSNPIIHQAEEIKISQPEQKEIIETNKINYEDTKPITKSEKESNVEIEKIIQSKKKSIVSFTKTDSEESKKPASAEQKKQDTMRVEPGKLDALMTQAGELIVTKNRISNRLKDVNLIEEAFAEVLNLFHESRKLIQNLNQESKDVKIKNLIENSEKQNSKFEETLLKLDNLKKTISHDITRLSATSMKIERSIFSMRMLPLNSVFNLFHRTIRDLSKETNKKVNLDIIGGDTTIDKQILEEMKDPLMHILRNAVDHAIESPEERTNLGKEETAALTLFGRALSDSIIIEIIDDGKGIDPEKIKQKALEKSLYTKEELDLMDEKKILNIIFHHGFSTRTEVSSLSGRGVGMDVVKSFVEKFKGDIETISVLGQGTTFRIRLPLKFSTTNLLIFKLNNQKFGIPTENIVLTKTIRQKDIFELEGKSTILIEKEPYYVFPLEPYLELSENSNHKKFNSSPSILLKNDNIKIALLVDELIEKNEVIVKSFEGILKRIRNVSGMTILDSGEICIVLNPKDLIESILRYKVNVVFEVNSAKNIKKKILVIDDSLTTRVQLKRIIEAEGFQVDLGVDGEDGWEKLKKGEFNFVLTDLEMPKLTGLELTKRIKDSKFKDTPVVLLTSLGSEEQIRLGLETGADAYLIKSKFDRNDLISTIKRFI